MKQRFALLLAFPFLLFGCEPEVDQVPGTTPFEYGAMPFNFTKPAEPENNQTTVQGVELGRMLFYEKKLSADNSISCGTCHQQKFAFSDGGKALSTGVGGAVGKRNTMAIVNLAWENNFMWDGVAKSLEEQAKGPMQNPLEMHQNLDRAVNKLQNSANYPPLFLKAFGSKEITEEKVLKAISQFERTLVSVNSRYDQWVATEPGGVLAFRTGFTPDEVAGYKLFAQHPNGNQVTDPLWIKRGGNCGDCHTLGHFTNRNFANNGLDAEPTDKGLGAVTGKPTDNGKFKIPTLRNIALTAPYMHDGRFENLEQVLEHYNDHVKLQSPNIAPDMFASNSPTTPKLDLNDDEKRQIIAFLKTLTDENFVKDERFSDPFAKK
jgi:cytochrome c peroxidase